MDVRDRHLMRHSQRRFSNKMADEHLEFSPFDPITYFLFINYFIVNKKYK